MNNRSQTLSAAAASGSVVADTIRVPQDHQTIQAAIDAASRGDTVMVAAGTYRERLRLKEGVTLRSAGDDTKGKLGLKRAEATIIDGGGKEGEGPGVAMAERATLDGFTVTNVGVFDEAEWNKHHATQGNNQPHEHIGEPGTAGISAIGVTCTIANNIVHHIGYSGIALQGAEGQRGSPHVVHNVCYRNMGGGIGSMGGSTAVIEANTCFQNFYAGIGHEGSSPLVVKNVCYENIRAGIGISEGSKPIVRGNQCHKNRRAGIGICTGAETRPLVEDNDCFENDMAGIGSEEECQPILRDNRCRENALAGIGCRDNSRPTIVGNECSRNKAAGIGFDETEAGQAIVLNSRVFDNEKVAIGIYSGWKVRLAGNELSTSKGMPPVVMVFKGAEADFSDNTLRGAGVAGIRVEGTIRVTNNTFETPALREAGPPQFAVWGLPGSDITFTGNQVSGWRHALLAEKSRVTACDNRVTKYGAVAIKLTQPVGSPALVVPRTICEPDAAWSFAWGSLPPVSLGTFVRRYPRHLESVVLLSRDPSVCSRRAGLVPRSHPLECARSAGGRHGIGTLRQNSVEVDFPRELKPYVAANVARCTTSIWGATIAAGYAQCSRTCDKTASDCGLSIRAVSLVR